MECYVIGLCKYLFIVKRRGRREGEGGVCGGGTYMVRGGDINGEGGGGPHNSSVEGGMIRDIFAHLASCKTSRST